MSLRRIFEELYATAALTGEASQQLAQGAAIRVRADGPRRQVILSRQGAPVGTIEVITFQAHGRIPGDAVGVCYLPTAAGLYRIALTWEETPPAPTLFDLPPATSETPRLEEPYRLPEIADLPDSL